MRKFVLILLVTISFLRANSQFYFGKTYGGENEETGVSLVELPDYSFLLLGNTGSFGSGSSDIYLVKTDSLGVQLWYKTYGGPDADVAKAMIVTKDSNIVIAGYTKSFGNADYNGYVLKMNFNGDTLWTKSYGGVDWDFFYSVAELSDSGLALVGETYSWGNGLNDAWVLILDKDGNEKWQGVYGGNRGDAFTAVKSESDSSFLIVGNTNSTLSSKYDIFFYRVHIQGEVLSTSTFQTDEIDEHAEDFEINIFGEVHVVGYISVNSDTTTESMVYKFNPQLGFMYEIFYDVNDGLSGKLHGVTRISDDGYIYAGESEITLINDVRAQAVKTTYGGFFEWTRTFGNQPIDVLNKGILTHDSCYAFIGSTQSFGPGIQSMFLWKIGKDGETPPIVVVNIEKNSAEADAIGIYPNPVKDLLNIQLDNKSFQSNKIGLKLYDMTGKCLMTNILQTTFNELNLSSLKTGVYLLELSSEGHIIKRSKIIKH